MAWIAALVAAAYGGYQQHAQNQKARKANARNAELFANNEPDYFGRAMRGFTGGNKYQKDLTAIAQGTYMDPNVLAKPIADINRGTDTNMQRMASTIGRSNMSGGLANAYALANAAGGQMNKATLKQNYGLWRENQRRKDLDWINTQKNVDLARRSGNAEQIANRYQNTGSSWAAGIGAGWGTWAGSDGPGSFGDVIAGNGWTGSRSSKDWKPPLSSNIQVDPYAQRSRMPGNPYGPPARVNWWD